MQCNQQKKNTHATAIALSFPGGYHYLHVEKPQLPTPLEILMQQNDYVSPWFDLYDAVLGKHYGHAEYPVAMQYITRSVQ
jgi:hypothetical protein